MANKRYYVPSELLACEESIPYEDMLESEEIQEQIMELTRRYGIDAQPLSVFYGPSVTTYAFMLRGRCTDSRAATLARACEIYLNNEPIRCVVDQEENSLRVEVPSEGRAFVELGELTREVAFENVGERRYPVPIGKNEAHKSVIADLKDIGNVLITGTESAGKSTYLHGVLCGLFYTKAPWELRAVVVDTKKWDFAEYDDFPHLVTGGALRELAEIRRAVEWLLDEATRRLNCFDELRRAGERVSDVREYNERAEKYGKQKMPIVLLVIDELQDLMTADRAWFEIKLCMLLRISGVIGVHVFAATASTCADVLTEDLKEHFSTRMGFAVDEESDSRSTIGQGGAEKLLGYGDFLFLRSGEKAWRLQAACVTGAETFNLEKYVTENYPYREDGRIVAFIKGGEEQVSKPQRDMDVDLFAELTEEPCVPVAAEYVRALRCVIEAQSASLSMIQRKCNVGYNRAGKIMQWMEERGYVSPFNGAKTREVLLTKEDFEMLFDGENEQEKADSIFLEGLEFAVENGKVSLSLLQRRCGFSFAEGTKVLSWLEKSGYTSSAEGGKPRSVYISKEEFIKKFKR
ncbi:MAG: hypothetical protein IJY21_04695 [Clostridia bacterium]|nr:hypothetical protein [Clostridia bacterium]